MQKEKIISVFGMEYVKKDKNVFYSIRGGIVTNSYLIYLLKKACQKIGIENVTFHCMRDTFATRFIENGGNMNTLKELLGHSSISITMDIYAHVLEDTKQKEIEMVNQAFKNII